MAGLVRVSQKAISRAVNMVLPGHPEVAGAYLFGSALEECRPDSDVDLGLVLFPEVKEPPGYGFISLEARIEGELPRLAGHRFDVNVLRPNDVIFSFKVISTGQMIYAADVEVVTDFVEAVARRYADIGYRYRRALEEALES
ncbi:MAG: nucleotidyltransferase domain-containing protein [Clostridia bacterium]|nr:MAG: nucleotidyltransferase domain-containing protein [Clostridia bacterium]